MTKSSGKARVTITLRNDLLPLLDNFIDGEKIRNRSHAIEYILGQHLGLGIRHIVIFAGSDENKKVNALTRVQNRPVIAYIFDSLKSFGVKDAFLVVDEYCQDLKTYLGDGAQWGVNITYIETKHNEGTAVALAAVRSRLEHTFMLIYSDQLADLNFSDYVAHHQQGGTVGTVALTYSRSPETYGVARMEGSKIVEYSEKPGKEGKHGLVNAGVYIFEPTIFDYMEKGAQSLEKDVLPHVASTGQLAGYPFQGKWFDISEESDLKRAENEWR